VQGHSFASVAALFDIPRFDLVHVDVGGAEAEAFRPGADLSWLGSAKVVAVRLHRAAAAAAYGAGDVEGRVAAAGRGLGYKVAVVGGDLLVMVSPGVAAAVQELAAGGGGEGGRSGPGSARAGAGGGGKRPQHKDSPALKAAGKKSARNASGSTKTRKPSAARLLR
jgi:hypothetical protein